MINLGKNLGNICRNCFSTNISPLFNAVMLGHEIQYYECSNCLYVQTEYPHWLDVAYESPINASDTGIMARNIANRGLVLAVLSLLGGRRLPIVDCAGGNGILVRLLRDIGIDAYWQDPYADNLLARGFEYLDSLRGSVGLVTSFESFEHFVFPGEELKRLSDISDNVLFTTTLIPAIAPRPAEWWYYGLDHGQHIGFFRAKTLRYLASSIGCNLLTDNQSIHLITRRKISSAAWKLFLALRRAPVSFMSAGLHSLTWHDHLRMAS